MRYPVAFCLCLLFATMLLLHIDFETPRSLKPVAKKIEKTVKMKDQNFTILAWNSYWNWYDFGFGGFGNQGFKDLKCKFNNCYLIKGKYKIKEADALLIHGHQFEKSMVPRLQKMLKKSGQKILIYFNRESPRFDGFDFNNLINITMTYRQDSDIFNGYGKFIPISQKAKEAFEKGQWMVPEGHYGSWSPTRSKDIAWIVSHCETDSKRESLAKEWNSISNLTIDLYGKCGGMKLPPGNLGKSTDETLFKRVEMYLEILKDYKFYLSFENSLCKDYITEKFFLAFKAGSVPIAYGGLSKSDYEMVIISSAGSSF